MEERQAFLLETHPEESLLAVIPKLVDPVSGHYAFPSHSFFEGIKKVHAEGFDGSGMIVGIVDTGIDAAHPLLKDAILDARDFTSEGSTDDLHGHGTLVGLIIRYVAPKAKLVIAKAFGKDGGAKESQLSAALRWVRSKSPNVVNLSAGISESDPAEVFPKWLRSYFSNKRRTYWLLALLRKHWFRKCAVCEAARELGSAGTLLCVAVGNQRGLISCPARSHNKNMMVVGAANIQGDAPAVASYSSYWPDLVAPEIDVAPGTSFSTPFVSGTAAVLTQVLETRGGGENQGPILRRADLFFEARQFKDAIVCYLRGLEKFSHLAKHSANPAMPADCLYCQALVYTPRMKLAFAYLYTNQPLMAAKFFQENVSIAPNFPAAHMNLGAALREAGLIQDSIAAFQRTITLSPGNAEAYLGLGDAYVAANESLHAIEAFEQSFAADSQRQYLLGRILKLAAAIGDIERVQSYGQILSQRPPRPAS